MKLNELIEQLTKLRDANPALGDLPITMEDTELGDMYPADIKDIDGTDGGGIMLKCA